MFYSLRLMIFTAGSMLGSSLLFLSSSLAIYGIFAYYSWFICTIAALILGYLMSNLGQVYNNSGGPYIYAKNLTPQYARFIGIIHLIALIIQLSSIYFVLSQYCSKFVPPTISLITIPIINYITNRYSEDFSFNINMLLNILKMIPIIILLITAFLKSNTLLITECSHSYPIIHSTSLIIFAFSGFEFGLVPQENKVKNIMPPIIAGILIGAFFGVVTQLLVCNFLISPELSISPLNDLAFILFGKFGYFIMSITCCLFCITAGHTSFFICGNLSEAIFNNHIKSQNIRIFLLITLLLINILFDASENYLGIFATLIKLSDFLLTIPLMSCIICYRILFPKNWKLFFSGFISILLFMIPALLSILV